jgi:hypothetical protein
VQLLQNVKCGSMSDQAAEHIDCKNKQLGGEGVALSQSVAVPDGWSRLPSDQDPRVGGTEKDG